MQPVFHCDARYRRAWRVTAAGMAPAPRNIRFPQSHTIFKVSATMLPSSVARSSMSLAAAAMLAGCASLPSSGPTASVVAGSVDGPTNVLGYRIVAVDSATVEQLNAGWPTPSAPLEQMRGMARNDAVGPGDVLAIDVFEVGVSLFSGGGARVAGDSFDPSARGQDFTAIPVDSDGTIKLPYIGRLNVAGRTPAEIEELIENGLRAKSQSPQAIVSIKENVANTVFVSGDVRLPGRLKLTVARERLLDAVASSGGTEYAADDVVVRFARGGQIVEQRLGEIRAGTASDVVLMPGDRVQLIHSPRTFTVFGATSKVSQVPFETGALSLAEAVARAGGPNDNTGDASAVFLFRFDPTRAPGTPETPIIYRLNMLNPASYFLSQRFAMRDKDVIYIANARSNQPTKLVGIINQLFAPFITARQITR
jgi:polysaccharide export outer membrane protein